jgi:hypothetical protein
MGERSGKQKEMVKGGLIIKWLNIPLASEPVVFFAKQKET